MNTHLQLDRYGFDRPAPKFDNRHVCHCIMCKYKREERRRQRQLRNDGTIALMLFASIMTVVYFIVP